MGIIFNMIKPLIAVGLFIGGGYRLGLYILLVSVDGFSTASKIDYILGGLIIPLLLILGGVFLLFYKPSEKIKLNTKIAPCPQCYREIPIESTECPHCGKQLIKESP